MPGYIPQQGDFILLDFDPQSGHEQKGRRPALVVSHGLFNLRTGLVIACPITRTDRKYPFHVSIPAGARVTGFVMVEQVKSVDFHSRKAKRVDKASAALLEEVLAILDACIY